MSATADLECIDEPQRASTLLDPLRLRILQLLSQPGSSTEVAGRLGLPRQKVNYHVRKLAEAGFLKSAGRRKKRNMMEQRWLATARSYLLTPEVVAPLRPDPERIADKGSAAYLLAATGRVQSELGRVMAQAEAAGQRVATLTLDAAVGFTDAAQRAAFARALEEAVAQVVARHSVPVERAAVRPFRLSLTCHPMPAEAGTEASLTFDEPEEEGR